MPAICCTPSIPNAGHPRPLPSTSTGIPSTPGWSASNPLYVTTAASTTPPIDVSIVQSPGCANGVPYMMRTTLQHNSQTGALMSTVNEWVSVSGAATATMPVGFAFGDCVADSCTPLTSRGILSNWS